MWRTLGLVGFVLHVLLLGAGCRSAALRDWPQFRGRDGNPVDASANIPARFGPERNAKWNVPAPPGHSSPAIVGDRMFLTAHEGSALMVLAYDRRDGSAIWATPFQAHGTEECGHRDCSPSAPTPCADRERVYAYFGAYGLVALDHDGRVLWKKEFPLEQNMFGTGTSPILGGDSLYLVRDVGGQSAVYCFDKKTGEQRWMTPRPDVGPNFSTPYLWRRASGDELVVAGSGTLRGYDAAGGREKWVVTGMPAWITPSPVAQGDVLVFGAFTAMNDPGSERMKTGFDEDADVPEEVLENAELFVRYFDRDGDGKIQESEFPESRVRDSFTWGDANQDGGWDVGEIEPFMVSPPVPGRNVLVAVRGGGTGDITSTHVLWTWEKALPYVASPLIYRGRVYIVKKGGLLSCIDLESGQPVHDTKRLGLGGEYYATPVAAGDKIFISAERGTIFAVSADGESSVLARNDLGVGIYATPAIVDDTLYVRTAKHLWAFRESGDALGP